MPCLKSISVLLTYFDESEKEQVRNQVLNFRYLSEWARDPSHIKKSKQIIFNLPPETFVRIVSLVEKSRHAPGSVRNKSMETVIRDLYDKNRFDILGEFGELTISVPELTFSAIESVYELFLDHPERVRGVLSMSLPERRALVLGELFEGESIDDWPLELTAILVSPEVIALLPREDDRIFWTYIYNQPLGERNTLLSNYRVRNSFRNSIIESRGKVVASSLYADYIGRWTQNGAIEFTWKVFGSAMNQEVFGLLPVNVARFWKLYFSHNSNHAFRSLMNQFGLAMMGETDADVAALDTIASGGRIADPRMDARTGKRMIRFALASDTPDLWARVKGDVAYMLMSPLIVDAVDVLRSFQPYALHEADWQRMLSTYIVGQHISVAEVEGMSGEDVRW